MKSTQVYQYVKILALIVAIFGSAIFKEVIAQDNKKGKKVSIKIIKELDGKRNLIDTTFTVATDEEVEVILKSLGVENGIKDLVGNYFFDNIPVRICRR